MSLVTTAVHDGVALLTLNNPPANAYSHEMHRELDEAILLLLTGDAIGALRRIAAATGTTPAIAARIHREAAALDTAAAIRQLEKTAEGNAMDYLRLLPLLDRFIKECRDTIAFVLNSDGTTSIF